MKSWLQAVNRATELHLMNMRGAKTRRQGVMMEVMPDFSNEQGQEPAANTPEEEAQAASQAENAPATDVRMEELQKELEECRTKQNEYLEGWQRARADFSNYKKRVERDQAQAHLNAIGTVVKRYLEILDDLERALKNRPAEGDGAGWSAGIEQIYRKLQGMLEKEGVKQMDTDGQMFDPNLHEAVTSEDSQDHESGEIIEVVQQGYLIGDRVLRPAMVRVAK